MNNNLLIIFVRNPELGKVKTRLAKSIGDKTALEIYQFLLQKTKPKWPPTTTHWAMRVSCPM